MKRPPDKKDPKRVAAVVALLTWFICLGRGMKLSLDAGKPIGFIEVWPSILAFWKEYGAALQADAQKVKAKFKDLTAAEKSAVRDTLRQAFNLPDSTFSNELDTAIGNAVNFAVSCGNVMGYVDGKYVRTLKFIKADQATVPNPKRVLVLDADTYKALFDAGALTKATDPAK